jgi:hypothetical protein
MSASALGITVSATHSGLTGPAPGCLGAVHAWLNDQGSKGLGTFTSSRACGDQVSNDGGVTGEVTVHHAAMYVGEMALRQTHHLVNEFPDLPLIRALEVSHPFPLGLG